MPVKITPLLFEASQPQTPFQYLALILCSFGLAYNSYHWQVLLRQSESLWYKAYFFNPFNKEDLAKQNTAEHR
ncbi:MAG: hypothetical protein BRD49_00010 [Bacteroidetes bacterium SW_10_40_5]|nr:MAG: hypothetical protein BRD49_00010 [Bacteroidetes bacterium SW_10_40_5]